MGGDGGNGQPLLSAQGGDTKAAACSLMVAGAGTGAGSNGVDYVGGGGGDDFDEGG